MKKPFLLLTIFLVTTSFKEREKKNQEFHKELELLSKTVSEKAHLGVAVYSLDQDRFLYEKNGKQLFIPSSIAKIFPAGNALYKLGTEYVFRTKLMYDGTIEDTVLKGNIYLKGSGDPTLNTAALEELRIYLQLKGIKKIQGSLVVDGTIFDTVSMGPGWMWDESPAFWNAKVSGLMVNHSCEKLFIGPASKEGKAPVVISTPSSSYFKLENSALTTGIKNSLQLKGGYASSGQPIEIEGSIVQTGKPVKKYVPVDNPSFYTGVLFRDLLKQRGIEVGDVREGTVPSRVVLLGEVKSPPMRSIVGTMLKESDNLYVDAIFKRLGTSESGKRPGSWQNGAKEVHHFLQNVVDLDMGDMVLVDGGLSRYNLVSPRQVVDYLKWITTQDRFYPEFAASLPISGVDGSLKERMTKASIKGRFRAKTGTMQGVRGVAGYMTTTSGEKLIVVVMINNFIGRMGGCSGQIEEMLCEKIVAY